MNNNEDFIHFFEQKLCDYTGAPYAVVVDRCTNAILLSLKYLKIKKVVIPANTYLSVPMTLLNYNIKVEFNTHKWEASYCLKNSNVYDYAVGFEKGMFVPGQIQCLSFQQKKRLAIGKGGAILLDDPKMYHILKRMRHDGRNSQIPYSQERPGNIIIGYHMNMSPDEAVKGLLLMNQLSKNYVNGSFKDYTDISKLRCFEPYL